MATRGDTTITRSLPRPSGPFAIGTVSSDLIDTSREERFGAHPGGPRELMVQVWYPAEDVAASPREAYLEDARRLHPLSSMMGLPIRAFDHLTQLRTDAGRASPIATAAPSFPVLVFSHGRCGFREHNTVQVEELVSHGFVVAAIDHPHLSSGVLFSDGRLVPFDLRFLPPWPRSAAPDSDIAFDTVVDYLAEDVRFVLDQLTVVRPGSPFEVVSDRLDLGRVGVFGPSLGGRVAARAAVADPRIGAALFMDIAMPPDVAAHGPPVPAMWMSRDAATMERERWSVADIEDTQTTMRAAFAHARRDAYLVIVPGMFHPDFSDGRLLSPLLPERGITGPIDGERARAILGAFALAFFDRHLRGGAGTLLDGATQAFPEVRFTAR